nr:DUF4411 family protein [Thiocystis minor]
MIHAWDNYPLRQFPGLWEWMADQIAKKHLVMPDVAFEEVMGKTPDCGQWLKDNHLERLDINNAVLQEAMRLKGLLGIVGDQYHVKGVGENDILIIATALVYQAKLVSDEGMQHSTVIPAKRKIPTVCAMPEVAVSCVKFIEFIKRSGTIF